MKTIEVAQQEIKRIKEEQEENSSRSNSQSNSTGNKNNSDDGKKFIFMISNEVPYVMAKAVEMFIRDITTRAWIHTDTNRRKTIQKSDVIHATSETETYDFLIDVVPRVGSATTEVNNATTGTATAAANTGLKNNYSITNATTTMYTMPASFNANDLVQQQSLSIPLSEQQQQQSTQTAVVVQQESAAQKQLQVMNSNNDYPSSYSTGLHNDSMKPNKKELVQPTPMTADLIFSPLSVERPGDDDVHGPHDLDETPHQDRDDLHQELQHSTNYYDSTSSSSQQQWTLEWGKRGYTHMYRNTLQLLTDSLML